MFGKILSSVDNTVVTENTSGQIPLYLKGIHVGFPEQNKVIVGKIIDVKK